MTRPTTCPDCGAAYARFRAPDALDFGQARRELGRVKEHVGRGGVLREMCQRKLAAWSYVHGPGRCVAEYSEPIGPVDVSFDPGSLDGFDRAPAAAPLDAPAAKRRRAPTPRRNAPRPVARILASVEPDPAPRPADPGPLSFLCDPCDPMTRPALGAFLAARGTPAAIGIALATAGVCAAMDHTSVSVVNPRARFAEILGMQWAATARPAIRYATTAPACHTFAGR